MKPSFKYLCLILAVILQFPTLLSAAPVVSTDPAIEEEPAVAEKVKVVVTILPQKYIVEALGGDHVDVSVLIEPGMNPHMSEPLPQQMEKVAEAQIHFVIGLPLEGAIWDNLQSIPNDVQVYSSHASIPIVRLLSRDEPPISDFMTCCKEAGNCGSCDKHDCIQGCAQYHYRGGEVEGDPHIWMDPEALFYIASNISRGLSEFLPEEVMDEGHRKLSNDIRNTKKTASELLSKYKGRKFLTYHPAFGYFADRFGLKQQAIEHEGKEPTPRQLAVVIRYCEKEGLKTLLMQSQFPSRAARTLARTIDAKVIYANPLSENPLYEIVNLASKLAEAFEKEDRAKK